MIWLKKETAKLSLIKKIIRYSEKYGIKNVRRLADKNNLSLNIQRKILNIISRRSTIDFKRNIKKIMSSS